MFVLHNSNRLEFLARELAGVLKDSLAPLLHPRTVVVDNPGMARWLSFELASNDSICANVRFPLPGTFIWQLMKNVLPKEELSIPYDREQLAWLLMKAIPEWLNESSSRLPWELKRFSEGEVDQARLYHLSHRLADLFDRYLVYRPDMVLEWESGKDDHWQASLWRYISTKFRGAHRAGLLKRLLELLRDGPLPHEVTRSPIAIFGISHLPPVYLEAFFRLARHTDVHLFLLNPCKEFWEDALTPKRRKELEARLMEKGAGGDQLLMSLPEVHPLLASMGTLGRVFLTSIYQRMFEPDVESDVSHLFQRPGQESLLSLFQEEILDFSPGEKEGVLPKREVRSGDFSIQIHSCHSRLREVEVLHDQLLELFSSVPGLAPHEVLVMAPDIQEYAPLVEAVFESVSRERYIPWALTDLPEYGSNPFIQTFLELLDLSLAPPTAPQLMDILEVAPVSRRFGLDGDGLEELRRWVGESGIRRGLGFSQDQSLQNTWRFGIDRLMVSYSFAGEGFLNGILPYETPVEGDGARSLGALSLFVSRVARFVESAGRPRSSAEWSGLIVDLLDGLFLPQGAEEEAAALFIRETAAQLEFLASGGGIESLEYQTVRDFFRDRLSRSTHPRRFISGKVTFSSLVPMRAIPARVICLLGMNDSDFPRRRPPLDFDLMARNPRSGDKFPREEDRYLFLETLISARECLYISYVGRSERDNSLKVVSGVVSELLDALEQRYVGPGGKNILEHVVVEHPLKPFSSAYCEKGHPRLFTYASEWQSATASIARSGSSGAAVRPFISTPLSLDGPMDERIVLDDLISFFANPAKFFLVRRLNLDLEPGRMELEEWEPFYLEKLEGYLLAQELLDNALLAGEDGIKEQLAAARGRGCLPFPPFDTINFERVKNDVMEILPLLEKAGLGERQVEVDVTAGGFVIQGRIRRVGRGGVVGYRPGKISARDMLSLWIKHLAFTAIYDERERGESIHVGRAGEQFALGRIGLEEALDHLALLASLYMEGLQRPLPFFPDASLTFAKEFRKKGKGAEDEALRKAAKILYPTSFEHRRPDPWMELAFRGRDPLGEEFVQLSLAVFDPMLNHLQEESGR